MTERRPGRLARTLTMVGSALALLGGIVTPIAMSRVADAWSILGSGLLVAALGATISRLRPGGRPTSSTAG